MRIIIAGTWVAIIAAVLPSCKTPLLVEEKASDNLPATYGFSDDSINTSNVQWRSYFTDPYLNALIDTALKNNRELNIMLQEIEVSRNEIRARKGEYLPFIGIGGSAGLDKVGRYTRFGALENNVEVEPGLEFPEPYTDYQFGAYATWEIDIWKKLRNAKKAAVTRYLASVEGRNFMVTNLIAEMAKSYYELLALDNQLEIVKLNIQIQSDAMEIVRMQKEATRVTELAVKKFEAEVFRTRSLQFDIQQQITESENHINYLAGRLSQHVDRNSQGFNDLVLDTIEEGLPSQLLANRPDVRQAELELESSKLDVKVARARFYPSIGISASLGYQAFNPAYLIKSPESMLFSVAGDLIAPLINRSAISAEYYSANAKQIQAVYNYEQTIINAYIEVANQLSLIENLGKSYDLKSRQVNALTQSINISTGLFTSARADYMEVLMTQRDALESRFELVETKKRQMNAMVDIYRVLGGGWK